MNSTHRHDFRDASADLRPLRAAPCLGTKRKARGCIRTSARAATANADRRTVITNYCDIYLDQRQACRA
jgi:hypothetical protein